MPRTSRNRIPLPEARFQRLHGARRSGLTRAVVNDLPSTIEIHTGEHMVNQPNECRQQLKSKPAVGRP